MEPGEISHTIILWALCPMFPHNSTHISCIYDTAPWPFSFSEIPPVRSKWSMGQGAEESPLCYLPEHATAQKAVYRKEPINNTFSSCSLQQTVGASWGCHNTGAGMSETEIPGKARSLRSDIVSPIQKLLFCCNCMSWLQNFGLLSFKSYFHFSFIPSEILTTESALSPCFKVLFSVKKKTPPNIDSQGSKRGCCSQAWTGINCAKLFVHRNLQKMTEFLNHNTLWKFNMTSN